MTELQKKDGEELLNEYVDTEKHDFEKRIEELREEVASLKELLTARSHGGITLDKLKEALGSGSDYLLDVIKPIIEKYEKPTKQVVEKANTKVSDNPFLSVTVAFATGIIVGTVLNFFSKLNSND